METDAVDKVTTTSTLVEEEEEVNFSSEAPGEAEAAPAVILEEIEPRLEEEEAAAPEAIIEPAQPRQDTEKD